MHLPFLSQHFKLNRELREKGVGCIKYFSSTFQFEMLAGLGVMSSALLVRKGWKPFQTPFFELFSYVSMGINFACLTDTDCSKFMIPRT